MGPGTSDQSLFRLRNKIKKILYLLYIIWPCDIKRFFSYSKNYTTKFMRVNSWHHKLLYFHLSFWILKNRKGRGKITKIWISREWEELFWRVLEELSSGEKKIFEEFLRTPFSNMCVNISLYKTYTILLSWIRAVSTLST